MDSEGAAVPSLEDPVQWMDYFKDKPVVGLAAGPAVEIAVDDPHFRLPTQPKVVAGWGGTGEALDPHVLVEGEVEGTGVVTHDAEGMGGVGGDTPGGEILSPGADEGSSGNKADSEEKTEGKKRKKGENKKRGGKERRQVGVPRIARWQTKVARRTRRTSRGRWSGGSTEDTRLGS